MNLQNNSIVWTPGVTLDDIERQVIEKAFNFFRGNKTATSQSLGIAIRTLENKLGRYEQLNFEERRRNHETNEKRREHSARERGGTYIPEPFGDAAPTDMAPPDADAFQLPPPAVIKEPILSKKVVMGGR